MKTALSGKDSSPALSRSGKAALLQWNSSLPNGTARKSCKTGRGRASVTHSTLNYLLLSLQQTSSQDLAYG
jgi:hypothetical protein